jgi:hypothetical protein
MKDIQKTGTYSTPKKGTNRQTIKKDCNEVERDLSLVSVGKLFGVHFMTVLMSLPSSTETEIFLTCLISCYCTR